MSDAGTSGSGETIAIIGMAGRFPGAPNVEAFWHNLKAGVESISFFTDADLRAFGVDPALLTLPNYVNAGGMLEGMDRFDAAFFGFSPKEAEWTDPQHRVFLECAFEALESAGYDPERYTGLIGVYAGAGMNPYALHNLSRSNSALQGLIGNDKDFLTTRVSYKLNLKGPSVTVQTACSTSLVAVQLASQGLMTYQCDIALAGGVSIAFTHSLGYLYEKGGIMSPDGHCRAFDVNAQGTVVGDGAGIVVLKRLDEALADGDTIHAVIKGSAINNDGTLKAGYTAPSIDGQAEVIALAQANAEVSPETISYIEAHGTGTALGDPIEIAALTEVFRASTEKRNFCAIGSLKTNVGHLNATAGVGGLIKTVLMLKHKMWVPSLHFTQPNPQIDFDDSPFFVNTTLSEWKTDQVPRRAGVSSFGIGGTNAHVVLEEAPLLDASKSVRPWQLLTLSAKSSHALETATANLAQHLAAHADLSLADVAYTLQVGRGAFAHRRTVVCQRLDDAVTALETRAPNRVSAAIRNAKPGAVVFMFPGQGAQHVDMALELYEVEARFRERVDFCSEFLKPHLGLDLRQVLYPADAQAEAARQRLQQTAITQPALFVIEYALAQLWMAWGLQPQALIGHSIGEYVAACLAGVFCLEDALTLVATRGRLLQQLPAGAMLAVPLPEREIQRLLPADLDVAAVNAPNRCVVAGPTPAVDALAVQLAEQGIGCQRLQTSHAFHSKMVEPILAAFAAQVKTVKRNAPDIPCISNLSGTWMSAVEATDANYWARHLRQTVRFSRGLEEVLKQPDGILLEVGPGHTLHTLVRSQLKRDTSWITLASLRHARAAASDVAFLLNTLGKLWLAGVEIDWFSLYAHEQRRRIPLPTYPFERQRYWVDIPAVTRQEADSQALSEAVNTDDRRVMVSGKRPDLADWFYVPSWKRSVTPLSQADSTTEGARYLLLMHDCSLAQQLTQRLEETGAEVMTVKAGGTFAKLSDRAFILNPHQSEDYATLIADLVARDNMPDSILHLWEVGEPDSGQLTGFYSLFFLAQALGKGNVTTPLQLTVVSTHLHDVAGEASVIPERATLLGPVRVIPQEYPHITCRSIDVLLPESGSRNERRLMAQLLADLTTRTPPADTVIAYRGNERLVQTFEPVRLENIVDGSTRLRQKGVYLITGGLGGIGLALATYLAQTVQARLILTGRSAFPAKDEWATWLSTHHPDDRVSSQIRHVQELERLGAAVRVYSADVANQEHMQRVIAQAVAEFAAINGVIHAAGVPGGGVIQRKTPQEAETVMTPKVTGTRVLDALLQNSALDFFVLCSSLAAVEGIFGQVDYAAANAFLDAFAHQKQAQDGVFTVSINWDVWQEVGMAVDAAKQLVGVSTPRQDVDHPLFERYLTEPPHQEIYISQLNARNHWVLNEHRIAGRAVLPGTAYLEMARAAFQHHAGEAAIEMRDVFFLTPLSVEEEEEKEVRTILTKQAEGFAFSIVSPAQSGDGNWQEHARGHICSVPAEPPTPHNLNDIKSRCHEPDTRFAPEAANVAFGPFAFGARWHNLKQVQFGEREGLATIELAASFNADCETYRLHPALLDTATAFLLGKVAADDSVYLPFSYQKLSLNAPLPRQVFSHVRYLGDTHSQKETLTFDITILDEQGIELVAIDAYTLRRVDVGKLAATSAAGAAPPPPPDNVALEIATPGDLSTLTFRAVERRKPGPGEVEIEVAATGLNFKDVLLALGAVPSLPGVPRQLGLECSGTIVAIGDGVKDFEVGESVMAFGISCFRPFVTTPALLVASKPAHLSPQEAATIPAAFMTAYYALMKQGRLSQGDRVLIHAAAGGVGMAAVNIAQWVGADIFATAGSPEKRDFLRSLGIHQVMDSRSLAFADEVMQLTNGRGVDVILNSLAGDFIPKGLSILAPYGRFLEIGVRDIYHNSPLGLGAFAKSLTFVAILIGPDLPDFASVWREVVQHVAAGHLNPLPYRAFPSTESADAFQYMAQARHIGKIVVSHPKAALAVLDNTTGSSATGRSPNTEGVVAPRHGLAAEAAKRFLAAGLLPAEGVEVFTRILQRSQPQLLVSTQDLRTRMEPMQALITQRFQDKLADRRRSGSSHPRPHLPTPYAAPRNEIEQTLAEIWQDLLGIERIGIDDNFFFELGGDSLLAIQLNTRLREHFAVDFSVHQFFEAPTIAQMAERIATARQAGDRGMEEIVKKLEMIEGLSDDEVKRLLAEMKE